ncbi:hypothetical protein LPJ66_006277 [Kickxella alabastrina]|uniref:Uncharacterized protein n=1 Tax=Kickxella alabastrina TaxID=61397 RepID=A0ACC1IKH7_9FUNG|nr:hypothetical protein LPJ66_006277 [Kickxella alabastrina]
MQQSQTPTTEDTAVDAQPAATAVASNYYQRAHGSTELSDGKEGVKLYYAAAENDNLGWELGDTVVDPMYTINRRRKEEDVTSKDSFFKRLRVKLDKNSTEEVVSAVVEHNNMVEKEKGEKEDSNADAGNANAAPVIIGGMPFGFGMMNLSLFPSMGAALADDSSERKKSEKTSKSKKNKKDKEKSDEKKKKRKHKDKD